MPKITPVIIYTLLSFLLPSLACAATLENIQGMIKINQGNGYKTVDKTVTVQNGDRVMASLDSSANIIYSNGVSVPVRPGRITIVNPAFKEPMTVGRRNRHPGISSESQHVIDHIHNTVSSIDPVTVLVGGVAIAGGVAAIIALSKDDDKPASK